MKNPDRIFTISAAFFSIAYVLLRFWGLADSCLWFDEIFGVHAAEQEFRAMLWFVAQDLIHPPLFYILLKGWIAIGGESVFWLRSFSVFFAAASLAPFLLLCKELKISFTARIIALAFFSVSGSLIKYAQEVRMYSLLLFLSLASTWLFARFFFRGKNIWILTLVNILLVYTHYFGWLVVASEIAAILIFQRIKIRHVLIMFGILAVSYVPWVWAILQATGTGANVEQNIGWIEKPGIRSILDFAFDIVEPFYFQETSISASSILVVTIPLVLLIAIAKVNYFVNWRHHADMSKFLLLAVFTLPILLAFVLSWMFPVSIWGSRHLISIFPPVMILIGMLIDAIDIKAAKGVFVSVIIGLFAVGFAFRMQTQKPDFIWCAWEQHAKDWILTEHYSPDPKTLYVFEDLIAYHFWFATRGLQNYRVKVVRGVEGITEDKAYFLPRGFGQIEVVGLDDISDDDIWTAFRDPKAEQTPPGFLDFTPQPIPISAFAKSGYDPEDSKTIDVGDQSAYLIHLLRRRRD